MSAGQPRMLARIEVLSAEPARVTAVWKVAAHRVDPIHAIDAEGEEWACPGISIDTRPIDEPERIWLGVSARRPLVDAVPVIGEASLKQEVYLSASQTLAARAELAKCQKEKSTELRALQAIHVARFYRREVASSVVSSSLVKASCLTSLISPDRSISRSLC